MVWVESAGLRERLVAEGMISPGDMNHFLVTDSIAEAVDYIQAAHQQLRDSGQWVSTPGRPARLAPSKIVCQSVRSFYQPSAVAAVMAIVNRTPDSSTTARHG